VRGYQQNLLGPVVYVVSGASVLDTVGANGQRVVVVKNGAGYDRAVPRGGTAMIVANLEWRRGFRFIAEELQFAAFVDAGNVWETHAEGFRWGNLRATPPDLDAVAAAAWASRLCGGSSCIHMYKHSSGQDSMLYLSPSLSCRPWLAA
jgi:outer membrane protein assembly factor BamA